MIKLGLIISGANGYMGGPALETLLKLKQHYEAALTTEQARAGDDGTKLELVMLADPDFFNAADLNVLPPSRKKVRPFLRALGPAILEHNAQWAKLELDANDMDQLHPLPERFVFYDASPTEYHERNALALLQKFPVQRHYFGEKPIFLDPAGLEDFEKAMLREKVRPNLYCDFIETGNPAVQALKRQIEDRRLSIRSMTFWRTGISGIKHAFGHEQHGVQGGAILDKCPHDIAISTMLLEPENILSPTRADCQGSVLLPIADFSERWTSKAEFGRGFLRYDNEWARQAALELDFRVTRQEAPADGLAHLFVNWRLNSGAVIPCEYVCGWLGVPIDGDQSSWHPVEWTLAQKLQSLGYRREEWVGETQFRPSRTRFEGAIGCLETQARLCFVEAEDGEKNKIQYIANLYTTSVKHDEATYDLPRWVDEISSDAARKRIYQGEVEEYPKQKAQDRQHVFDQVIRAAAGIDEARYVGPLPTVLVHKALLYARDDAFSKAAQVFVEGASPHRVAAKMAQDALLRAQQQS